MKCQSCTVASLPVRSCLTQLLHRVFNPSGGGDARQSDGAHGASVRVVSGLLGKEKLCRVQPECSQEEQRDSSHTFGPRLTCEKPRMDAKTKSRLSLAVQISGPCLSFLPGGLIKNTHSPSQCPTNARWLAARLHQR